MTEWNENLIEIIVKTLQYSNNDVTGPLLYKKVEALEAKLDEYQARKLPSWETTQLVDLVNGLKELGEQLGKLNTRIGNLEKKSKVDLEGILKKMPIQGSDFDIDKDEEKSAFRTQATEAVKEISNRSTAQFGKKRGPYKKRKSKESGTVVLQNGPPTSDNGSNVFGAKTTSKYNKAISVALSSKHFTKAEIIAEVRVKHAKIHRFPGKELVYQVRKAKWRLDARRRRDM